MKFTKKPDSPGILRLRFIKYKTLKDFRIQSIGEEITNLPNILTTSRMALIPIILYFTSKGTIMGSYIAAFLFVLAGITDGIDGYLARKYNKITLLGQFLDPLADKLTTLSVVVYLAIMQLVPGWLLILMLFREFAITGLRTIAMGEGVVISASHSGKSKTAFQFIGITWLLVHYPYYLIGTDIVLDFHRMGLYILYLSLVLSLFSAFEYFALFRETVERKNRNRQKMLEQAVIDAGLPRELASDPQLPVCEEHEVEVKVADWKEKTDNGS
ncbi:CDP-diacylglycerol--glycerol-3-phosphate 3-phosphatidyltransferase [Myxococcota bacterium]|nr:CDP-diacylglycerol--glycerol-3-phosphate 3-phosphatidyltransferase [Myxococcota bacterium]MBU1379768.1 CDP-diacylglycerol--glycerol-3-phosphate 3-phosphatidyltransferase [Myxococcota bacterium]MBU1498519.1 CDP-diacylglycerol--glycerol-3-phosphate 3-phosphatidyltransferase [Myxococcota bacterium]